jgi:hypothetical protein
VTDLEAQQALVHLVANWLDGAAETSSFVDNYWATRRKLLRSNPGAFDGPVGQILSHMDTALHSYWPEPQGSGEIGEAELRQELGGLVERLREQRFPVL